MPADRLFIITDPHTPAAVRTVNFQFIPFGAWLDRHAMSGRDPDHFLSQHQPDEYHGAGVDQQQ